MLKRGLLQPRIQIPTPPRIEKVDTQHFISGIFTDTRPLNALEISQLVYNHRATEVHKEFTKGAAQVTNSEELKGFYQRGVKIFNNQLEILQLSLSHNELPMLPTWETEILDTTDSPFSERIMLYKHAVLTSQAAGRYGATLSRTTRKDIAGHFMQLMMETLKYGEDLSKLFLDQLPMAKKVN